MPKSKLDSSSSVTPLRSSKRISLRKKAAAIEAELQSSSITSDTTKGYQPRAGGTAYENDCGILPSE